VMPRSTRPRATAASVRVGTDIVDVEEVAASVERFGDRYLRRIYTDRELAYCTGNRVPAEHLAARFAAKEATIKILRPTAGDALAWRTIEVVRAPEGWCHLRLIAGARAAATRAGVDELEVSLSHEARYATAVVVARAPRRPRPSAPKTRPLRTGTRSQKTMPIEDDIRAILKEHAKLTADAATLAPDADLHQAGMTSHASVNVMLALEGKFDIEFPDRMLRRGVFSSVAAIRAAVEELTAGR